MEKNIYPKMLKDNSQLWYLMSEFMIREEDDVKCLLHRNYSNDMHYHDFYEINLICNGVGFHYFDTRRLEVRKGDFFVVPVNVKHGYINVDRLDVMHMLVSQRFIDRNCTMFLKNKEFYSLFKFDPALKMHYDSNFMLNLTGKDFDEFVGYCENIMRRQSDLATESTNIVNANATAALFLAFRCYREHCASNVLSERYALLDKVVSYIFSHFAEKIDIEDLARLSGYSRANFYRFFKKVTSLTPNDFIDMYRINVARELLLDGQKSITDVAVNCGFYDAAHFIRLFKKYAHTTPGKFRNS